MSRPPGLVYLASPRPPAILSVAPIREAVASLRASGMSVAFWADEFARVGITPDDLSRADPERVAVAAGRCVQLLSRAEQVLVWPGTGDCPTGRAVLMIAQAFQVPIAPFAPKMPIAA